MAKSFEIKTVYTAADRTGRVISGMQARIQKFAAKASMALRRLDRFTGRISQGLGRFLRRGALAGAGAVGLLFHGINKTAEAMDALAKKTRAINFPIEEFQEFRFAAEQSGVSAEMFDKSMIKFTKTVGEAKAGYGTMLTALKKTNPQLLKQLKNTDDVSKAFDLYLSAIRNTPGAMNKAALATAAFGRSGTTMINMANMSAEQLEELRSQMRQNGVVTAEQAAKAESYNDIMNRLGLTVKGFAVEVISPLLPKMTEMADKMRQWMVANRGLIKQKISDFLKNLPGYIDQFRKGMSDVLPLIRKMAEFLGRVARFVQSVDWGVWAPRIAKIVIAFYALRAAIKVSRLAIGAIGIASKLNFGILRSEVGKSKVAVKGLGGGVGKLNTAMGVLAAGAFGWEIGTLLHDNVVDPLMQAQDRLNKLMGSIGVGQKFLGTASETQLQSELKDIQKAKAKTKETPFFLDPLGLMETQRKHALHMAEKNIRAEMATRAADRNLQEYFQGGGPVEWGVSTQVRETVDRSEMKIILEDRTSGKVRVEGGRPARGVQLVHTGSAP